MNIEDTHYSTVRPYELQYSWDKNSKHETRIVLGSECKVKEVLLQHFGESMNVELAVKDFNKQSQITLYTKEQRVILLKVDKIDTSKSVKFQLQGLKKVAKSIIDCTSKHKITELDLEVSDCFKDQQKLQQLLALIYQVNHKVEYKGRCLKNIKQIDKDQFQKESEECYANKTFCQLKHINLVNVDNIEKICEKESGFAKSLILAKNMGSLRANMGSPTQMTRICEEMFQELKENHGNVVSLEIIRGEELLKRGLNLIHAVGRGYKEAPVLVDMYYKGDVSDKQVVSLVGKGITFDTGGLNIKTMMMEEMFMDKCGACTVISVFKQAVDLKLKINLSCTVAWVENSISSDSYRPSDVIESYKGLTVEIGNTDAEGRLILADCMSYAQFKHKTNKLVELSTLTGAMCIALGTSAAGCYGNNEELVSQIVNSSHQRGEDIVPLPLFQENTDNNTTVIADVCNMPKSRWGGAGNAAAFLHNFIEKDVQYAHIDIAGYAMDAPTKSATGNGAQSILQFVCSQSL